MKQFILLAALSILLTACGEHKRPVYTTETHDGTAIPPHPGKALFMGNCAQCHTITKDATGPALNGVVGRWYNDTDKIVAFVKNSQKVIAKDGENSYTGKLFTKWFKTSMPAYDGLSDTAIKQIINYVNDGVIVN